MALTKALCGVAAIVGMMTASATVLAQDAPKPSEAQNLKQDYGRFYLSVGPGLYVPGNHTYTATSSVGTANGTLNEDKGAAGTITFGFHLNDLIALEAQETLAGDHYQDKGTAYFSDGVSLPYKFSGSTLASLTMVNGIITPLGHQTISPFVGGGAGFAIYDFSGKGSASTTAACTGVFPNYCYAALGTTDSVSAMHGTSVAYAINGLAGVDLALGTSLAVGARYQLIWTSDNANGGNVKVGSSLAHIVQVNGTVRF